MEDKYIRQTDATALMENPNTFTKSFTFSRPNIVPSPARVVTFDLGSEHGFNANFNKKNVFTFAAPTTVAQYNTNQNESNASEKQYKPKIYRNAFKPSVNMFAQALKDTAAFEQLKKNSRSQVMKVNVGNSITCTGVPKGLLPKTSAKEYFMVYGHILKIAIRPKRQMIVVFYATKEEANEAYCKSGEYMGDKFNVEWTKLDTVPKSPVKKKNIVTNLLKASDNEVQSELEAMMNQEYNLHNDTRISNPTVLSAKRERTLHSKPKKVEKMIAKSEKHEAENQIITPVPNASIEELQNIIYQTAFTSEDKYKVLEARDKLMRLKQVKSLTLATAKATSGTCPDMCPEKERLMRESQRQVAAYEQLEGSEYKINHMTAVKQYSRSSADQEEPMSHDLRPVKSLKMSMSYLLHEIADLCEKPDTNLGEWYHFLWDRTRGIRKDITQQELCCINSVELVEQCARFHIVCSERLCAEESSIFDKKINSENLTKCLQSLKYMYHDLREKGIACQNEPEFQAYIILLNLNNGNFMWDLQRLPESIQKSSQVQFAINVYLALESNNYCKFFKLVQGTTYLNACVLLRYFNQVRVKALSIMVKAYCRTTSTAYPLYELIDSLGFEDENEAIYFCEQVGLNVSNDELHILLNRKNFSMPVSNIEQGRALNVIESKRTKMKLSIGQCIAGGKMPEKSYLNHKPHNSFDDQGHLLPEAINAEDQRVSETSSEKDPYEFIDEDTSEPPKLTWAHEKNQNASSIQIKKQTVDTSKPSDVSKPVASESNVNIFSTGKTESTFSFSFKPVAQSTTDNKSQTNVLLQTTAEKSSTTTTSIFSVPHHTVSSNKNETPDLRNVFKGTSAFPKLSPFTKPSGITSSDEISSPFAMATKKSIFSGTDHGNIFAQPSVSTNIFPKSKQSTKVNPLQSVDTVKMVTDNTDVKLKKLCPASKNIQIPKVLKEKVGNEKVQIDRAKHGKLIKQIDKNAEHELNELQTEVMHECCSNIVREEINKIKMYKTLSEKIIGEIVNEITHEICDTILIEELTSQQKLREMLEKIKHRAILKYFNAWKQYVSKRKQQREALNDTPVWLQKYSVEECAKLLYHSKQDLVIENMCRKQSKLDIQTSTDCLAIEHIPIEHIIHAGIKENLKSLDINTLSNLFWKLTISWPDLENKMLLWHHKKIMNQYLCPENYTTEPIVKVHKANPHESLYVCIRHFEGFISDHNLIGTDALLFIAAATEEFERVSGRLKKTVSSREKLMPIPLIFVVLGDGNLENEYNGIVLDLEDLLESGYISEYTIAFEKNITKKTILSLTQNAVLWLAVNKSPSNPLEMDYLQNIYDTCLTEELWLRILDDAAFNKKLSRALKEPNFIIGLHNETINHLIDIIMEPESLMYTKFAPEFKRFLSNHHTVPCSYEYFDDIWKDEEYRAQLENIMNSFILPQWSSPWPITDLQTLRESIMHYCRKVLSESNSNIISCDILSNIFLTSGSFQVSTFVDILLHIIKEKINLLNENLRVVYNKNHIKHFRTLPWWLKSQVLSKFAFREEPDAEYSTRYNKEIDEPMRKRQRLETFYEETYEYGSVVNEFDPLAEFCENTRTQIMEIHSTSKEIEDRLRTQQIQSQLFQERLEKLLFSNVDMPNEGT